MVKKKKDSNLQGQLFPTIENNDSLNKNGEENEGDSRTSRLYAIVKPEMMIWGRKFVYLSLQDAAQRIGIQVEKLQEWEDGISLPTISQLHKIAKVYRQSFAVFYLSSPPRSVDLPVKDLRRLASSGISLISYELANEIRSAVNRREIAIQLLEDAGEEIPSFSYSASFTEPPALIGRRIRSLILSNNIRIPSFHDKRKAFNFFRQKLEDLGILVFQAIDISTREMRGFSLSEVLQPVIVINRQDSYAGRTFSLFHELTHILLRTSGICDIEPDSSESPEEQKMEVFCNQVAAEILMPDDIFKEAALLQVHKEHTSSFTDNVISQLSDKFGVSREAIVRRLSTFGFVSKEYYQLKREQYQHELVDQEIIKRSQLKKKDGFPTQAQTVVSQAGKPYIRLVLSAVSMNQITLNDASGYLNVRINQLQKVGLLAGA